MMPETEIPAWFNLFTVNFQLRDAIAPVFDNKGRIDNSSSVFFMQGDYHKVLNYQELNGNVFIYFKLSMYFCTPRGTL